MIELRQTTEFAAWMSHLPDRQVKARIAARLARLELNNWGDVEPVGEGVSEMRIHCGPVYRVYLHRQQMTVVVLLCGGDKSSQSRDIVRAKELARSLRP